MIQKHNPFTEYMGSMWICYKKSKMINSKSIAFIWSIWHESHIISNSRVQFIKVTADVSKNVSAAATFIISEFIKVFFPVHTILLHHGEWRRMLNLFCYAMETLSASRQWPQETVSWLVPCGWSTCINWETTFLILVNHGIRTTWEGLHYTQDWNCSQMWN